MIHTKTHQVDVSDSDCWYEPEEVTVSYSDADLAEWKNIRDYLAANNLTVATRTYPCSLSLADDKTYNKDTLIVTPVLPHESADSPELDIYHDGTVNLTWDNAYEGREMFWINVVELGENG